MASICYTVCVLTDEPYRAGYEGWLLAEMGRILILTSTLGFTSRSCHVKMLFALIISVAFLTVFLYTRPYRRGFLNGVQTLAMLMPIIGMARDHAMVSRLISRALYYRYVLFVFSSLLELLLLCRDMG